MTMPVLAVPTVRAHVLALVVALAGMGVQIATGVDYGPVPPGVVILAVCAALLATWAWAGVRVLGVIAPAFILLGGFVSETGRHNISGSGGTGPFIGTVIQFAGLAAAVVLGIVSLTRRPA